MFRIFRRLFLVIEQNMNVLLDGPDVYLLPLNQ